MKKVSTFTLAAAMIVLFAFKSDENATWSLDKAHAKLSFTVTHMMVSDVEGWFKSFDAKITGTQADFSDAVAEMTAEVSSINTDNEMRDNHLKSADFFDAAKYPVITFKSKTFKKISGNSYKVTGDLTMHGITKTIVLDALCRMGMNPKSNQPIAGFKITGTIKRSDYAIGTSMADNMISNEVIVIANAEFDKK